MIFESIAVGILGILVLYLLAGIRYVSNGRVGVVEKRISFRGSLASGVVGHETRTPHRRHGNDVAALACAYVHARHLGEVAFGACTCPAIDGDKNVFIAVTQGDFFFVFVN